MEQIQISIQLDPIRDGTNFKPKSVSRKDRCALVIGTDGSFRIASEDEAYQILEALSGVSESDYIGKSTYLAVFNANKVLQIGYGKFLIGSAIIIKAGMNGIEMLSSEEVEEAKEAFVGRLATLVADGQQISAYEIG